MKKKITIFINILIIITLCLCLSSCKNNELVNNSETGEISTGDIKYEYIDGTYMSISKYYNNDGYGYAMRIIVQNGIINSINFDAFNINNERFSQCTDEKQLSNVEHFKAEIKNLTNALLQNQTFFTSQSKDEKYSFAFKSLANATVENAKNGNTQIEIIDLKEDYTQVYKDENTNIYSTLNVTFSKDRVTALEFERTNEFGSTILNYTVENTHETSMSYNELMIYLNELPEDRMTLKKDNPTDYPLVEVTDYNRLCDEIMLKRILFEADYDSLFSNL